MPSSNGYTVMVIDDEVDLRDSLTEVLQAAGYDTASACNGRDALNQLRGGLERPDAIVLDMMMPTMDGLSFRWEQLADSRLADIPVIILSASGYARASAIELETAGCIQKPCSPEELLETVARVCRQRDS